MNVNELYENFLKNTITNIVIEDVAMFKKTLKEYVFKNNIKNKDFLDFLRNLSAYNELNSNINLYYEIDFLDSLLERKSLSIEDKKLEKYENILSTFVYFFEKNFSKKTMFQISDKEDFSGIEDFVELNANKSQQGKFLFYPIDAMYCMFYAENYDTRKKAFDFLYGSENKSLLSNKTILSKIINLKQKLAKLKGFDTYSDFVFSNYLFSKKEVVNFIKNKRQKVQLFIDDWEQNNVSLNLNDDIVNYNFEVKKSLIKDSNLSFSTKEVFNGIKKFLEKRLETKINKIEKENHLIWSFIFNGENKQIFFDFAREDKSSHYNFSLSLGKNIESISLLLDKNTEKLSFDDLLLVMHELGHSLEKIFKNDNSNFLPWDVIEVPSLFLERFCFEADFLKEICPSIKISEFKKSLEILQVEKNYELRNNLALSEKTLKMFSMNKINYKIIDNLTNELLEEKVFHNFYNDPFMISTDYEGDYGLTQYSYVLGEDLSEKIFQKVKNNELSFYEVFKIYFNCPQNMLKLEDANKRNLKNG